MDLNSVEVFEMMYDRFGAYFGDSLDEPVARICVKCRKVKYLEEYHKDSSRKHGKDVMCIECRKSSEDIREYKRKWIYENSDKVIASAHRRRTRVLNLPSTLTDTDMAKIKSQFGGCALTGSDDVHMDHVIPVSIGHGGTTNGNMIPLRSDLNVSKNDRNIFEWFSDNKDRFNLSQTKFDELIEYLAKLNDKTVEEYRDYVYWCHDNRIDSAG